MEPLKIINPLRKTDPYIQNIFSMGGCYQFFLFLKTLFPDAIPYMHYKKHHVITRIDNRYYDIDGEISDIDLADEWYVPFTDDDYEMVKDWSFSRNHLLSAGECKFCGEPITLEAFVNQESVI